MRHGYTNQEGGWIDTVCRAMNRWAMAKSELEAEARLWAGQPDKSEAAGELRRVFASPETQIGPARGQAAASIASEVGEAQQCSLLPALEDQLRPPRLSHRNQSRAA
ncbi:MAG TPA: hypothetical protein VN660_00945 [Steroidobacteraceae bacterium]|nr:hypothetical protein [Steroidobacteraceae bacterium]